MAGMKLDGCRITVDFSSTKRPRTDPSWNLQGSACAVRHLKEALWRCGLVRADPGTPRVPSDDRERYRSHGRMPMHVCVYIYVCIHVYNVQCMRLNDAITILPRRHWPWPYPRRAYGSRSRSRSYSPCKPSSQLAWKWRVYQMHANTDFSQVLLFFCRSLLI